MKYIYFLVVLIFSKICWCRCVCDPADALCLNNCVNHARDCIQGCIGELCFTGCINDHWPGTTFDDIIGEEDKMNQTASGLPPTTTMPSTFVTSALTSSGEIMSSYQTFVPSLAVTTTHLTITTFVTVTPLIAPPPGASVTSSSLSLNASLTTLSLVFVMTICIIQYFIQ